MRAPLSCSLVICTKDREADLVRAVQSALHQDVKPSEIVVVDAGRDGALESRLQELVGSQLTLIYVRSLPGLTRQRNCALRQNSADVTAFIDDDVVLESSYIRAVLDVFETDVPGEISAVLSRITNYTATPDGFLSRRVKFPLIRLLASMFLLTSTGSGKLKKSGCPSHPHHLAERRNVECLSGASMSFRRIVFDQISFDENLQDYAFMEDIDIARQLLATGGQIVYEPASRLAHYQSSSSRMGQREVGRMSVLNHHYLFLKHSRRSVGETAAFSWSLVGMAVLSLSDPERLRGVLDGVMQVVQSPWRSPVGSIIVQGQ